jgi:hypothetical protein
MGSRTISPISGDFKKLFFFGMQVPLLIESVCPCTAIAVDILCLNLQSTSPCKQDLSAIARTMPEAPQ